MTRLVEAILKAQGYTTYRSPEGADGGADILAGAGPLGFGAPRLCVEVKSESSPIDRPTVDKLLGAVTKFGADEGLFVSWSGFKSNVQKELAASFFKVRLWTQKELLEQLFAHYDHLRAAYKKPSDADLKEYLMTGTAPNGDIAVEAMGEVITNTTSQLTNADLAAMIAYLRTLPPRPEAK